MMPQWELLDFLNVEASRYPAFSLRMNAEASDLLYGEAGRISGIRLKNGENIRARLVIAADGRSEEHTSELQSLMRISYAVFCLTKKKHNKQTNLNTHELKK